MIQDRAVATRPAAAPAASNDPPADPGHGGALALTGERTLPGIWHENYWYRRHQAAYLAFAPFVRGARVLEAGSGEGYGAALFDRTAGSVVAVDYDPAVVRHAAVRYRHLHHLRADLQRLPLADGSVEVVAAMQVVEHLHDQAGFLRECARVLRPAGTLLLSTPNRLTFSPGGAAPVNPFHTRELDPDQLVDLLAPCFRPMQRLGLQHGRRLHRFERRHGGLVEQQLAGPPESWSPWLRRLVADCRAGDFAVRSTGMVDSLDLLVVAVRRPA